MTIYANPSKRSVVRALVVVLAAALLPGVVPPAAAYAGPSVELPKINPVPVSRETARTRPVDQASARALPPDAAARADKEGSGQYSATSLSPSASWDVALHTGDFTWSYPLRVPPSPGGLEPELTLSYRSSAVDGHTSVTNNQASWIGDGWDLSAGFIERTYGGCADDGHDTGDLCWRGDNATASFDGRGGMLVCCDGTGKWRSKNDDGSRIERFINPAHANGDNDGEHWRITTVDGAQYWFGSQLDANSTWAVRVFGDDTGEPCNSPSGFGQSHCKQAWRWNLDKVVDRNGNVIRYFYETETNHYGMNRKAVIDEYVRAGTLKRIDYGLHVSVPGEPTGRVEFVTANRCIPGSECREDKQANWPDTPFDRKCGPAACDFLSPSFWSTKRLETVTTKVRKGTEFDEVDRWTLNQIYPAPEDGKASLWLKSIAHTGLAGDGLEITLPPVTFEGSQFPNRVYTLTDGFSPLIRYRITGIIHESGGWTAVNYAEPDCRPGQTPANPHDNRMRCYPVKWAPPGHVPQTHYLHKYVVESVLESDALSSSEETRTSYEYLDGAAWHWDTSEFVEEDQKSWNEFRGFGRVRVRVGAVPNNSADEPRTMTEQRFYRGMHDDRYPDADLKRTVEFTDSENGPLRTDFDWLQGFGFERIEYENEAAGEAPVLTKTITDPFWKGPTASRGPFQAYIVAPGTQRGYTALGQGRWRKTESKTTYDNRGLPTEVDDRGDVGIATDDRCTTTEYLYDEGKWLLEFTKSAKTVAVACGVTPRYPEHAVGEARFDYDDRANLTRTQIAKQRPASGPVYVTASANYDAHGRVVTSTDELGRTSRAEFTPATGGPVTETKIISPRIAALDDALVTVSTLEPAFGVPTLVVDPNRRKTEIFYDALGRTTGVWLPNRPRLGDPPNPEPSIGYTHLIRRDGPNVVTTTRIGPNGIAASSNTLYDGLLRPRQTQTPAAGMEEKDGKPAVPIDEGRLIVDTRYDSHGRPFKTTQPYFNDAAVDTNLWRASDTDVPGLTRTRFDGAGRVVESIYQRGAIDAWSAYTSYEGDRVHTTPLTGGTATTVISDARGRTTELRQYHAGTPTGGYDSTGYEYTPVGRVAKLTGPDGAVWSFQYDLLGRQIRADDPDKGPSTMEFDDAGRPIKGTDARGKTLAYAYDELGRRTAVHENSAPGGTLLSQWTYDTATAGRGLPATAKRFVGGHAYATAVHSYTALNKPLETSVTIPPVEGLLAGSYTTLLTYGADGSLNSERHPGAGGLPLETVLYGKDKWGRPTATRTAAGVTLADSTHYTRYGEVERIQLGTGVKRAWLSYLYDTNTRRLARSVVDAEVPKPMQANNYYTYDRIGNITSIADKVIDDSAPDIQCFRYDHLRRVAEAWTPAGSTWEENQGCKQNPDATALRGPAPYWHSYRFDPGGNRTQETQRNGTATVVRDYTYPATGQPQPHSLRSVTGDPAGPQTYDYDRAGNTIGRVRAGAAETLNWDFEGHLESVAKADNPANTTSFIYTADGVRLMRKDPTGTTLYLGNQELRLSSSGGNPIGTRYYSHAGKVVAVRQGGSLSWLAGDHQATAQVAIDSATLAVTRRRQLPYGGPRGDAAPAWPGERGFVDGTLDASTGLTHLGAREYDPGIGRFISVDPVMDLADPQQMQGYSYANNSPVTFSDATGLYFIGGEDNQGNQYGISYGKNGAATNIGARGANDGHKTNRPSPRTGCGGRGSCAPNGTPPQSSSGKKASDIDLFGKDHARAMSCGASIGAFVCGPDGPAQALAVGKELSGYNDSKACLEGDGWGCFWLIVGIIPLTKLLKPAKAAPSPHAGNKLCKSFAADTRVLMADGSTKPINKVRVGDKVMAKNPETGESGAREVTHIWIHDDELIDLRIGGDVVTTTEDHYFWNASDQEWQTADQIDSGEYVLAADGTPVPVGGLLPGTRHTAAAYNLTVSDLHSYFVLAGPVAVLVHNDDNLPNAIKWTIEAIDAGKGEVRLNPDGTVDIFKGRELNALGPKIKDKWGDSTIYNVPNKPNYRILVNSYGDVAWADTENGKYKNIHNTGMKVNIPGPSPSAGC